MTEAELIIIVALVLGLFILLAISAISTKMRIINNEKLNDGHYIITVRFYPVLLFKLFGAKPVDTRYIGRSTVWYDMKTQQRAGTIMESYLSNKLEFIQLKEKGIVK